MHFNTHFHGVIDDISVKCQKATVGAPAESRKKIQDQTTNGNELIWSKGVTLCLFSKRIKFSTIVNRLHAKTSCKWVGSMTI